MNQQALIDVLSTRTGLKKVEVGRVLKALKEVVGEELGEGRPASVPGVASLDAYWRNPSVVRAPNGRRMLVDGRHIVRVRASGKLQDVVAARTPQYARDPAHQAAWRLAETLLGDLAMYHPDGLPRDVPEDASEEVLLAHCRVSFGPAWEKAVETYEVGVPAEVRAARNYLGMVALRLWGPAS